MEEHKISPTDTRPKCATCVHFVLERADGHGHCRALPPTAFKFLLPVAQSGAVVPGMNRPQQVQEAVSANWPPVHQSRWCGMHPDFLQWYSSHRVELTVRGDMVEVETKGAA